MMLRHLAWKDGMTIKPLLGAILIGIASIFIVLTFVGAALPTFPTTNFFVSFWVLMPNLVALGAPALLVGGEEESGTLQWLRTLPVKWQQVADSKFLVSFAALLVAWGISSAAMLVARNTVATDMTPYAESLYSVTGIAHLSFFSAMLLLCGFITAYLFRSPIAGLIAVIPLIGFVSFFSTLAGRWLLGGRFEYPGNLIDASPQRYLGVVAAGFMALGVAWCIQRVIAGRRLTEPEGKISVQQITLSESTSAYRPPLIVSTRRPSQISALLWQQRRQAGKFIVAMALLIAACILVFYLDSPRYVRSTPFRDFCPLIAAITATWLGGMVFYGDNVRRRRAFFADRGIPPNQVWWTRVLLPGGICLLLVALSILVATMFRPRHSHESLSAVALMILTCFSVGQLVGQWMKRPILTFFAGPASAAILGIILMIVYSLYQRYTVTAFLIAPILLFASWRLTGRWLAGKVDQQYHWRAVGYLGLAVLAPILVIAGIRVWSTPSAMPGWRTQTLAIAPQNARSDPGRIVTPGTFNQNGFSGTFAQLDEEQQTEWLEKELDSESVGAHVSLDDLNFVLGTKTYHAPSQKLLAVEILLKWANELRESVASGMSPISTLSYAERAEERAIHHLILETGNGRVPTAHKAKVRELVAMIPSRELRKESRRLGLLSDWRQYTDSPWKQKNIAGQSFSKYFLMEPVAYTVADIPFERRRADRYVDLLTKLMLDQLDHGLPANEESPGYQKRQELARQLTLLPSYRSTHAMVIPRNWLERYEDQIRRLRDAVSLPATSGTSSKK